MSYIVIRPVVEQAGDCRIDSRIVERTCCVAQRISSNKFTGDHHAGRHAERARADVGSEEASFDWTQYILGNLEMPFLFRDKAISK